MNSMLLSKLQSGNFNLRVTMITLATLALMTYAIGFSQIEILHDTFHEARHAVNLACH